ncbi:MAG: hypothetical protein WCO07_01550 [bacterium]
MTNQASKEALRVLYNRFDLTDNLFSLVEAMKIGVTILEENEFPIKEFSIYKYKLKRYGKEERLNK